MSTIDTSNIDQGYPVNAQDNDSQGMRNNFTNIVTALEDAKFDIESLEGIHANVPVPVTPLGVSGDRVGQIAADSVYIYYCVQDWAPATAIWVRILIAPAAGATWD